MPNAAAESGNFEDLFLRLLEKIFGSTDAKVTGTRRNRDGGLDALVEWVIDGTNRTVVFECKLRGTGNLDLRTIAANAIIAFNNRAISFVAVTNYSFTRQAAEELAAFSEATPLRIKIIIGEQIKGPLLERYPIDTSGLEGAIACCESRDSTVPGSLQTTLLVDLEEDRFPDFLFVPQFEEGVPDGPFCENILKQKNVLAVQAAVDRGTSILVEAPQSVDASRYIEEALAQRPYRVLCLDAHDYGTVQDALFMTLCRVWGSSQQITQDLLSDSFDSLFGQIDETLIPQKDRGILKNLFSGDLNTRDFPEVNLAMAHYVASLAKARRECPKTVFVFSNIQDRGSEIAQFLFYLALQLIAAGMVCVVRVDSGSETDPRLKTSDMETLFLTTPEESDIERYARQKWAWLSDNQARSIARQAGNSVDMADQVCCGIESQAAKSGKPLEAVAGDLLSDHAGDESELPVMMPALWRSVGSDRIVYAASLTNWRLVPDVAAGLGIDARQVRSTGLFKEEEGSFVFASPAAKTLFESLFAIDPPQDAGKITEETRSRLACKLDAGTASLSECGALLRLYRRTAYYGKALGLAETLVPEALARGEFSYACSLMPDIIEAAEKTHSSESEMDYRILHLRILFARKRVWDGEYDDALAKLKDRSASLGDRRLEVQLAIALFDAKQAMRKQDYNPGSMPIKKLEEFYRQCVRGEIEDNPKDLLGNVCHQHALAVKRRGGNAPALDAYKKAWRRLRGRSSDLNRGLLSHLACMNLADRPSASKLCYDRIVSMLESHPENMGLPLHAYCDQAMAELLSAKNLTDYECALYSARAAASKCDSHGAIEEVGRAYNIQGCAYLLMEDKAKARELFQEATTLLVKARYYEYAWRSELNLAGLLARGDRLDLAESSAQAESAFRHYMQTQGKRLGNLVRTLERGQLRTTREYVALLSFARCVKYVQAPFDSRDELVERLGIEDELAVRQLEADMDDFCRKQSISVKTSYLRKGKLFHIA